MTTPTMMQNQMRTQHRDKQETIVELWLQDGRRLEGVVFLALGQRVLDLLNDRPAFLPFRNSDQVVILIAKTSIVQCRPIAPSPPASSNVSMANVPSASTPQSN